MARCTPRYRVLLETPDAGLAELTRLSGSALTALVERAAADEVFVDLEPRQSTRASTHRIVLRADGDDVWASLAPRAGDGVHPAHFERIVQESPDIIAMIDRDFRHAFVNRAVENASGMTVDDFMGRSHDELGLPAEMVERFQSVYRDVFATGEEGRKVFEFPSPDGTLHYYESRVVPLLEPDGSVKVLLSYARDITEEHTRHALETKLLETQRLESLGLLAGGIAHDFNNLLASIMGTAAVARRRRSDPRAIDESLEQIEQSCLHAAELCRQMLAYAGRGRMAHEPLDLAEVIRETHELLSTSVSKDVAFSFDLPAEVPSVLGDRSQLQQVMMNLLLNGAEATQGDGHVTASARAILSDMVDWSEAILAPEPLNGELVELSVTDDGSGMDAETLERIFEPFFTTKFTGRGLGLAATLGILKNHGGGLIVRSEPGEGTTFQLYFRTTRDTAQPSAPPPRPSSAGPLRVLVIDDEAAVRDATAKMFEVLGHTVTAFADAIEALDAHASADPPPELVVLDLTMPGMDGPTAYAELRERSDTLPVILMSGYSEEDVADLLAHPATAFLHKPFRFGDLERALSEAVANGDD